MPFPAPPQTSTFKPVPAGQHIATCDGVYHLGWQPARIINGAESAPAQKIVLSFSIPGVITDSGKPAKFYSQELTYSFDKKSKLHALLTAWLGEAPKAGFDIESLVGRACILNLGKKTSAQGKERTELISVMPMIAGLPNPPPPESTVVYHNGLGAAQRSMVYEKLPGFLQTKISQQLDEKTALAERQRLFDQERARKAGKEAAAPVAAGGVEDDDIPF